MNWTDHYTTTELSARLTDYRATEKRCLAAPGHTHHEEGMTLSEMRGMIFDLLAALRRRAR